MVLLDPNQTKLNLQGWYFSWIDIGLLPVTASTGRLRPKWVPFSGLRYKKGWDFQVEVKNTIEVVEVYNRVGKSGIYVYRERELNK